MNEKTNTNKEVENNNYMGTQENTSEKIDQKK